MHSTRTTRLIAAGVAAVVIAIGAYAIGNSTRSSSATSSTTAAQAAQDAQAGQVPAGWSPGTGTIATGAAADKAAAAAIAEYPEGTVNRVLQLSDGSYAVHRIGTPAPHHIFVSKDFNVTLADWLEERIDEVRGFQAELREQIARPVPDIDRTDSIQDNFTAMNNDVIRRLRRDAPPWVGYYHETPDWFYGGLTPPDRRAVRGARSRLRLHDRPARSHRRASPVGLPATRADALWASGRSDDDGHRRALGA